MTPTLKAVVGSIAGVLAMFWVMLFVSREEWQLASENSQEWETPRVARAVHYKPEGGPGTSLTEADKAYLRTFGIPKLKRVFNPVFSREQKDEIMEAMRVLTNALDDHGIDYFLYGGSLIGSWRHHDVIPWDDDLDIVVNISSYLALERLTIPGYTLNIRTLNRYKFYNSNATNVPYKFWKWPFIDICFFGDNGTHIFDMDPAFRDTYVYDRKDIFPLVRRPFGDMRLKAPRRTEKILSKTYQVENCQSRAYDHKKEKGLDPNGVVNVNCNILHRVYPFVIRGGTARDHIENVYLNGKLINSVDILSP